MTEIEMIERWLYTTLTGDATITADVAGRVYRGPAPVEAAEPLIVFEPNANNDDLMGDRHHMLTIADYAVRAITRGDSFAEAYPIADHIHSALNGKVTTTQGRALACVRLSSLPYTEIDNGIRFNHLGGLYRITIAGGG